MDFDEILSTIKGLFGNTTSRQDKREQRAPALNFKFRGFQAPLKGALHNSGDFRGKHQGVDLRAPGGSPVFSIAPGTIKQVYADPKGGTAVVITHPNGYSSYYAHLGTVSVHVGDQVDYDTTIGTCGASGNAKGFPHVHFQTWHNGALIDPASIISMPTYTPYNPKKEQLWLPGAKAVADNWNIQDHLNGKKTV
jgi:murein DD-endopeptidase MepM/ murein hydrolase activator NlpD